MICASIGSTPRQVNLDQRYEYHTPQAHDVLLPDMPGVPQAQVLQYLQELLRVNPGLLPSLSTTSSHRQDHAKCVRSDNIYQTNKLEVKRPVINSTLQGSTRVLADWTSSRQGSGYTSLQLRGSYNMANQGNDQRHYSAQHPSSNGYQPGRHWRDEEKRREYWTDTYLTDNASAVLGRVVGGAEGADTGYAKSFHGTTLSGNSFAILGDAPASLVSEWRQESFVSQRSTQAFVPPDQITPVARSATQPEMGIQRDEMFVRAPRSRFAQMAPADGNAVATSSPIETLRRSMTGPEFLALFHHGGAPPQYTAAEAQQYSQPRPQPEPVERQSSQAKVNHRSRRSS